MELDTPPVVNEIAPADNAQFLRSGMIRNFGPLFSASGMRWVLRNCRLEEHAAERIRHATTLGPVVYVLHTQSKVDWLALNRALNARRLPLAAITAGVRGLWFRPLREALQGMWLGLKRRLSLQGFPDAIASGALTDAVARGRPTAVFLLGAGGKPVEGVIEALVAAQEESARSVQLVPVVVHWNRRPEMARTEVDRVLLGSQDEPGTLQKLSAMFTGGSKVLVQAGQAVDLQQLITRHDDEPDDRVIRRLRILLRRFLYRESRVVRGPRIRPYRWTRRLVLNSPEVRRLIIEESLATGVSEEKVQQRVRKALDHIAARVSFTVVRVLRRLIDVVFQRIFSGIDVREEDIERIREALRAGSPVMIPCHRSHLDYLLLSSVCYENNIVLPHIVAGENLSFWPMGWIFRRAGAFFIKRRFGEDRIFPVVFQRYLQQLIRDGFSVEFFIEGGRSRTGKLLSPRLGVLSMVLDSAARGRSDREVSLLPIAISYEQIAEERAYAQELAGADKQSEDIGQVVRASRVLGKRFGRVYIRVGEPILCSQIFAAQSAPWDELSREQRHEVAQEVGELLMYRISRSMVILPSGLVTMALLCHPRRGMRLAALHARVTRFDTLLRRLGARPAATLTFGGWATEAVLSRLVKEKKLARLEDEGDDIIQILEDKRVSLEFYKNGLIHFMAPVSLLAAAVRAGQGDAEVFGLFRTQVFLLRYEFTLDPEHTLESLEQESLQALVEYGALDAEHHTVRPELLEELAGVTANFLESYRLVLQALRAMRSRQIPAEELPQRIQEYGRGRLAVDELRMPESLSLSNLKNALRAYRNDGIIRERPGGGMTLDDTGIDQYLEDLGKLLDASSG